MTRKVLLIGKRDESSKNLQEILEEFVEIEEIEEYDQTIKVISLQYLFIKAIIISWDFFLKDDYRIITFMKSNLVLEGIPVICVSKRPKSKEAEQGIIEDAYLHGVMEFLIPPFHGKEIIYRINNLFRLKETAAFTNAVMSKDILYHSDLPKRMNTIWNPEAMDLLLLRAYVGAACFLQEIDSHVTVVRANERFALELMGRIIPIEQAYNTQITHFLDERNKDILLKTMNDSAFALKEKTCEVIIKNLNPTYKVMHIKVSLKLIDKVKERKLFYCTIQNDTERCEAVRKEKALKKQLEIVIQNFAGGITAAYDNNVDITYLYANDEYYAMFGYTRQQFQDELSGTIYDLILPEYLPSTQKELRKASMNMENVQIEYQAKKRDGDVIWIRSRTSVCHIDEVERQVYITTYHDITLEKNMERRVKTINERLESSEIFIQLDIIKRSLEEYRSVYEPDITMKSISNDDYSYEELVLRTIYESDRELIGEKLSYRALLTNYQRGDTKISLEYRRYLPSGEVHWFAAAVILVEGIVSGSANAFIYSHDIDSRMKRRLARDKILNTSVDDILIIHINSGFTQIVKLHEGSVIDVSQTDYNESARKYLEGEVAYEDRERCNDFFSLHNMVTKVSDDGSADLSYWQVSLNGINRRKNAQITFLENTHEDLLMVVQDITVLFEQEQEQKMALLQSLDLANYANESKSEFLSRMSHDMRTPLNTILGLTELLKRENDSNNLNEYINGIDSAGQYLLGLINDTLDLSKIEKGKMEFHEEPFSLEDFLFGINTIIKPLMDAKKITFNINLTAQTTVIKVDKMRFNQIFYNLLSNACKYTPEGGIVSFTSETIPKKNGRYGMRFHIKDNGIGMSREYQKVIFEPFTQENRVEKREQKGTGLGLAIVKKILDLTESTIEVKSTLNKGTEFILDIYAYSNDSNKTNHGDNIKRYDPEELKNIRVLLADDTRINTQIVAKILEFKGCLVDITYNGKEAYEKFVDSKEGFYDIILTDVRMPEMDGLTLARKIRTLKRNDAKIIPIIAATADAYHDILDKIMNAGMNARLVKPIKADELCQCMLGLLAGNDTNA